MLDLAREIRERRIPCDTIVFLSTYPPDMGLNDGVGTLDLHPVLWADAGPMIDELKRMRFHLVFHEYPVVNPKSSLFAQAKEYGYLLDHPWTRVAVMFAEGQRFLDFTNPEAADWWWNQHKSLADQGFDGWWLDGGEGPAADAEMRGGSGQAAHNVFDLNRQRAFFEGERRSRPERRHWMLCRSGYAGMQRFGSFSWSGDVNNTSGVFEAQIALGLSTAMSGIPYWGTDVGGFFHSAPEDPELYARWFQFGAFCPVFRSHGHGGHLRGWREHLPWAHGPEVEAICRRYAELRQELLPYNYSLAWHAHRHGLPLMRPMILECPDDPNVTDMADQYLWGPSLLVAPVTRPGTTRRSVYLPKGIWHDFWDQSRHDGGRWIETSAPLEKMPTFARAGAIVPLGPITRYDGEPSADVPLRVLIYPDGESSFTLYEDDGVTLAHERGDYSLTEIRCSVDGVTIRLTVGPTEGHYAGKLDSRPIVAQIRLDEAPMQVGVAGIGALRHVTSTDRLVTEASCWWHDGTFLHVSIIQGLVATEIEVRLADSAP